MNINFDVDNLVSLIYNTATKLCEKFGVIIDWSQENIMPYVVDMLHRYRTMAIIQHLMWPLCFVISFIWIIALNKKSAGKKDYFWDWYDIHLPGVLLIVQCVVCFTCLAGTLISLSDTLQWIFVPEIQWLDLIKGAIQ